jgi:hypothetical protein
MFIVKLDASGVRQVTFEGSTVFGSLSGDGKKMVYSSIRDFQTDIYVMDTGGSNLLRLTSNPAEDTFRSFSPDGRQVAFTFYRFLLRCYGGPLDLHRRHRWRRPYEIGRSLGLQHSVVFNPQRCPKASCLQISKRFLRLNKCAQTIETLPHFSYEFSACLSIRHKEESPKSERNARYRG